MTSSNETDNLYEEKQSMIESVEKKYEAAVGKDGPVYDVSGQGKALPWMLLNYILDYIESPMNKQGCEQTHNKQDGYSKQVVWVPTRQVSNCDIMNVLSSLLFEKMCNSRELLIQSAVMCNAPEQQSGIRQLNGNRFELFLKRGRNNGTDAFGMIVTQVLNDIMEVSEDCQHAFRNHPFDYSRDVDAITDCLIKHANHHAFSFSGTLDVDFVYENHAIIVSFEPVEAQDAHVDLDDESSFQYGFVMSNETLPTIHYLPMDKRPYLQPNQSLQALWKDIPESLSEALWKIENCKEKLNKYGKVLTRPRYADGPDRDVLVTVGSIMSLPAKEVHGGPKSEEPRAVMFFTGRPMIGATRYDDEVQFCITALIGDLLLESWLILDSKQRQIMLTLWWREGILHDKWGLQHIVHAHLRKMGEAIKEKSLLEEECQELISTMANSHVWNDGRGKQKWYTPESEWPPPRKRKQQKTKSKRK
jgi:hypothetical protein